MMKLSKLYCTVALLLGLTGCATTGPGGAPVARAADIVGKIQQYSVIYCSYEPSIDTVSRVLATLGGPTAQLGETLAENLARAFCTAVTTGTAVRTSAAEEAAPTIDLVGLRTVLAQAKPVKSRAAPPTVNGVAVKGKFVR